MKLDNYGCKTIENYVIVPLYSDLRVPGEQYCCRSGNDENNTRTKVDVSCALDVTR